MGERVPVEVECCGGGKVGSISTVELEGLLEDPRLLKGPPVAQEGYGVAEVREFPSPS